MDNQRYAYLGSYLEVLGVILPLHLIGRVDIFFMKYWKEYWGE